MPISWLISGTAGMVTAFNPCGIALLPSYLMYLLSGRIHRPRWGWMDGLRAGMLMTLGFILMFGVAGLLVSTLGQWLFGAAPILSILLAILLFIMAFYVWRGNLYLGFHTGKLTTRLEGLFARGSSGSFFAFGIAFGIASLSCSLPVFVSVASQGFVTGFSNGIISFLAYSIGMGIVITILSILATTARQTVEVFIRFALPYIQKLSAIVMIFAGLYLLWYWLEGPRGLLITGL
ncbi:cytochrome c biogenesis CcdA family protein [Ferroacidibacillus organovorans]|uniref:Cytochrome C biogenesis protein transmembrane domain-containing protein n=1 Tax=Ferroacidibacillus organovorans TaxID=1765683 RepID=A0A853K9T2_9BACL|nr:cytochrome c biogenesis protein CcdA [Ferroacidibacillus organovorans]KYP80230.1 hypothetical protein AYJ22_12240 [Ferroacidibacillus organovorans]OAG93613.1 hypothetical protein AYW79_09660 [Ferroacidibacillus organovorans]